MSTTTPGAGPARRPIGTHECPAPECDTSVRNEFYACRRDWYRLPNKLRTAIWDTAGTWGEARAAAELACVEYYRAHPRST